MLHEKPYWDIKALSEYLNIKPGTLYTWAAQGKIPCVKLHGLVRFRRDEIERWVDSCQVTTKPAIKRPAPSRGLGADLGPLIARAKDQAYNPRPRGNQTRSSPIGKEETDGAI